MTIYDLVYYYNNFDNTTLRCRGDYSVFENVIFVRFKE